MKKYLLGLLFMLPFSLLAAETTTKAPAWETYTYKDSGFSISLPEEPEHIEQKINIPKTDLTIDYNTYISEPNQSVVYVVSVWNYPEEIDMSKPEINLQDGFGGMLSALPGSEVEHMNMTDVDGFKALEFLVKNEEIYFQGKLILVHNTLYQVFSVYKKEGQMDSDYTRFVDSFKLIDPEKKELPSTKETAPQKMSV